MQSAERRVSKAQDLWSQGSRSGWRRDGSGMRRLEFIAGLVATLCMTATVAPTIQAAEQWSLMARHGECASVASLERKVPELGEVRDPQAFAALMRKGGHKVSVKQIPTAKGSAYEVVVPERELALVFVPTNLCSPSSVH